MNGLTCWISSSYFIEVQIWGSWCFLKKHIDVWTVMEIIKVQLILKAIYSLLTSPKKQTDEFILFAFLLFTANKSNSSVCFLGESTAHQSAFQFYLTFSNLSSICWGPVFLIQNPGFKSPPVNVKFYSPFFYFWILQLCTLLNLNHIWTSILFYKLDINENMKVLFPTCFIWFLSNYLKIR